MLKLHTEEFKKELSVFEDNLYAHHKTLFDLNAEFFRRLSAAVDEKMNEVSIESDTEWSMNFLFYRSYRLFWTNLVLCEKGFGTEACILLRSLMEVVVNMSWISQRNAEERAKLYRSYADIARKHLYDKYDKHGVFRKLSDSEMESIETREDIQKLYSRVKDDYREERFWAPKNIRSRAEDVGAGYDWEFYYWYFSFFVHSSAVCQFEHVKRQNTKEIFVIGPSDSPLIRDVLQLSAKYVLLAFNKWNALFQLGLDDLLLELLGRLEDVSVVRENQRPKSK